MVNKMNSDWVKVCETYAEMKGLTTDKVLMLATLVWVNRDIGSVPLTGYGDFHTLTSLLEGKKPFPGAFVKSADRKKVKGVPRPENDPTCYSFEAFWADYQYKTGKPGSAEIWALYDEPTRARIKAHLPGYVQSTTTSATKKSFNEYRPMRAMPQSYLRDQSMKYWKDEVVEKERIYTHEDMINLDGMFSKLRVTVPYQIAPDKNELLTALDEFKESVPLFVERYLIDSIQEFYELKGNYAGRLAAILRSQDFRPIYLNRLPK